MQGLSLFVLALVGALPGASGPIDPLPPPCVVEPAREWKFPDQANGWTAEHACEIAVAEGMLRIHATAPDPYLHTAVDLPGGRYLFRMQARTRSETAGGIYWTTDRAARRSEEQAAHFRLVADGQWHDYSVRMIAAGRLRDLRLDPGEEPGDIEIASLRLDRERLHPLVLGPIEVAARNVRFTLRNTDAEPHQFTSGGETTTIDGLGNSVIERPIPGMKPIEPVTCDFTFAGFPTVQRTIFVYNPDAAAEWIAVPNTASAGKPPEPDNPVRPRLMVRATHDGSAVRIERGGQLVALLGPLLLVEGSIPEMKPVAAEGKVRFEGDGLAADLILKDDVLTVTLDSRRPCEGPVVRPRGAMRHGLLAGLEYLSAGERSSSTLDIETDEHLRFAPDPLKVTMPLMAIVTDRASVAMTWDDMALQPVFATPNFFDHTDDHRMALRGTRINAQIRVSDESLEDNILWVVKRRGLPPLPPAPRSPQEQSNLCLAALNGPLKTEAGWGHCVEPHWPRKQFFDMASTVWRLSGQLPAPPPAAAGGSHIANESIFFVTGRAQEWLTYKSAQIGGFLSQQQPDGSFRYDGPFRRGHFEDTASGLCARPAAMMLEYARLTGDPKALAAGVRSLDYMQRFCVPRGAQIWELSLHTPDQLASAYLVWAYVRGFELTGKPEYLAEARRWAASGIPFVYLWSRYPIMLYATPPVYGATQWRSPNWMGLPVQWVGGVYAYALTMLARHDATLDWNQLARGILHAGEQMQYPDGPYVGLLPDSFTLESQTRNPWRINPCALVSLRLALDGEVDSLTVASDGRHRVAGPFPIEIRDGQAHVRAKPGVKYQLLLDGRRIIDVDSRGADVVPLE